MDKNCHFGHRYFALETEKIEYTDRVECNVPLVCTSCGELLLKSFMLPKTQKDKGK